MNSKIGGLSRAITALSIVCEAALFGRAAAGKRAVAVVNQEFSQAIEAGVELANPGKLLAATPEEPDASPTTGTVRLPARSAAVVLEQ